MNVGTIIRNAGSLAFVAALLGCGAEDPDSGAERVGTTSEALVTVASYDATLKVPKCASVGAGCETGASLVNGRGTVGPEPNASNTLQGSCLDGAGGSYHVDESVDRVWVYTQDGSDMAPGKTVTVAASVWAYAGYTSDWLDLYYAADANNPVWTLITTLQAPGAGAWNMAASYTIPAGASVQAVRAAFRYNGAPGACVPGSYNDRDDLAFAVSGGAPPDTTQPTVSITTPGAGATVSDTVIVAANAADNTGVAKVELYKDGVLFATDTTAPYTFPWNTTTDTNGSHFLNAKAIDAAGNWQTYGITVNVQNGTSPIAVYDPTLKAPKCASSGALCDTGTSAVTGRGPVGPEPNASNTIGGLCADGTAGGYHSDESVDRLWVYTNDGSPIAPGKPIAIATTVWAYAGYQSDALDLYYAADASNPVWTLITTLVPNGAGAQNLYAQYMLPAAGGGPVQAVRASFRYGGSPSPCPAGGYNDRDDLAFYVGGGAPPDTTPPVTNISAPSNGATVSGVVTITANAGDNVGVTKVDFFQGGVLIGTDTTYPYSASWDTTTLPGGPYTLTSKAYDAAGNVTTSSPVNVTVANFSGGLIVNGAFENASPSPWTFANGALYSASGAPTHGGSGHAMLHPKQGQGFTSFTQTINVPATGGTLKFWLNVARVGPQGHDQFAVNLIPTDQTTTFGTSWYTTGVSDYALQTIDLANVAGKTVKVELSGYSFDDWTAADPNNGVYFHVDDVSVF